MWACWYITREPTCSTSGFSASGVRSRRLRSAGSMRCTVGIESALDCGGPGDWPFTHPGIATNSVTQAVAAILAAHLNRIVASPQIL
jgi:hypothetical protein